MVLGIFLALCVLGLAQFNAVVQGSVTYPTGAVVPEATVGATNQATAVSKTAKNGAAGFYRVSEVPLRCSS
jgi:hypothetical protein